MVTESDAAETADVKGRPSASGALTKLGADAGLCAGCSHAKLNETRRGTAYLRCLRAAWDDRVSRYPRLPVLECPGFEAARSFSSESTSGLSGP